MLSCGLVKEADLSERAARRMTVEAFLAWQSAQDQRYELVDGLPLAMVRANLRHDRVTANALLDAVIEMPKLGVAIRLDDLYQRVPLESVPRPRLVWGDAEDGSSPTG